MYLLLVLAWIAAGVLVWGWINYSLEKKFPLDADKVSDGTNFAKYLALVTCAIGGPFSIIAALVACALLDLKLRAGLRFK